MALTYNKNSALNNLVNGLKKPSQSEIDAVQLAVKRNQLQNQYGGDFSNWTPGTSNAYNYNKPSGNGSSGGGNVTQPTQSTQPTFDYGAYLAEIQRREQEARDRAYQVAAGQQKTNYNYATGQLNDTTNRALQEAYVNKMLTLKNMPQSLSAQGINGGASESITGSMYNNYSNARNSLEGERQNQLAALLNAYQNNMAQLEAQRASGAAASLGELAPQLMGLAANNGVDLLSLIQATGQTSKKTTGSKQDLEAEYYV